MTTPSSPIQRGATGLGQSNPQASITTPSGGLGGYKTAASLSTTNLPTSGTKGTPTYTSEIISPDIITTRYIANQISQSLIGRNATDQEVNQYHQMFLEYAKTHPIYTRTAVYDPSSGTPYVAVRDITASKTPLEEKDFITNLIQNSADAKEYNAATTYLDSMMAINNKFRGAYSG